MRRAALVVLVAVASACAPKTVAPPAISAPKFPDFVAPAVPDSLAGGRAAQAQDRGWKFLEAGDLKSAEREFADALRTTPAFYPAESALGYVELARKDGKAALAHFDRSIEIESNASALVGRGYALVALNREHDAIAAFSAAVAADPTLADVKRRVEVLTFRVLEQDLARARQAARAGRLDEAAAQYQSAIASSPDSAVLYRELAAVERQKGDTDHALQHLRRANELEPSDAKTLVQIGDLLDARGDFAGAEKSYTDALTLEPNPTVDAKIESLRERAELARLPEEYRAIDQSPQITRGDLAALIGVRLAPLLQTGRRSDTVLLTDIRGNWASAWILAVTRAGVMDPFSNHAFQPRAMVRRVDLAQAVSRLLTRIAAANPARAASWSSARAHFPDLAPGHLAYPAASMAVASGVMAAGPDGSFQPAAPVSGPEAIAAIDRIEKLAEPAAKSRLK